MSGIVGLWNLNGRPVDRATLATMSEALRHRGPDGDRLVITGSLGLAHRHLWVTPEEVGERQPLVGPSGAALALDGRVDNRDELLARLDAPRTASDAALVLWAYEAWGPSALERLVGDFALGLYDPAQVSLWLVRDAIGLKPLYYYQGDGVVAFASEIKALLAHPAIRSSPNDDGVADYLLLGRRPAGLLEVTCFTNVRALPPAHILRVTSRGVDRPRRYWDFDGNATVRLGTFGEYAEAFRERFAQAVRRRARSAYPVAVSVSGGLDSSSILCQAETERRAGPASWPAMLGFSYIGPEGSTSDERRYLDEIERSYDVSIERIAAAPLLGLMEGAELQARHSEAPLLDSLWQITHAIQQAAAHRGARRYLTGHWGDQVLHGTAYLVDLIGRLAWRTARQHLAAFDQWFEPDEARNLRKQAAFDLVRHHVPVMFLPLLKWVRGRVSRRGAGRGWLAPGFQARVLHGANRLAAIGGHLRGAHARSLYLETRMKYSVQCMEWNDKIAALHGLDYAAPFLDRDLIQFLMAVPGDIQAAGGVPRVLLREGLAGVLPEAIRRRRWKADYSEPVNQGAARDLASARALFADAPRSAARGYVDRERVLTELNRLAPRLEGPECVARWALTDLIGLESWLRVFFEGGQETA